MELGTAKEPWEGGSAAGTTEPQEAVVSMKRTRRVAMDQIPPTEADTSIMTGHEF